MLSITSNTDAIFFSGRTGCRYSERPGSLLFSLFIVYIQLPPPLHFAPVLDFYVSYKHPSCAIITIPVSIHDTYTFFPPRFSSLVAVFFFVSASLAFVVLLSPPLRLCAGSPGGRAEREGAASVLMGGHYGSHGQRIIH
ncbi:hypothetical protein IW261DRAFT_1101024 [Armillaria novae-zelandiae]|uniref:Uncharacterized protein n=1 Tax=Armillaria novae-zelandiae TaxID=153914 RepID=A0AA39PDH4_9AGAR|nr:hypothetical protein IW261DRAFT_1101024 [Armillaria novae-zelandiae]